MRRVPAAAGLLLALALATGACGASDPSTGSSGPAAPDPSGLTGPQVTGASGPAAPTVATDAPVPEILRFETPLVGGGTLRGSELAGAPVALWFWAPW